MRVKQTIVVLVLVLVAGGVWWSLLVNGKQDEKSRTQNENLPGREVACGAKRDVHTISKICQNKQIPPAAEGGSMVV